MKVSSLGGCRGSFVMDFSSKWRRGGPAGRRYAGAPDPLVETPRIAEC